MGTFWLYVSYLLLALFALSLVLGTVVITGQNKLKHISLLGKFWFTAKPGISFKIPLISAVDHNVITAVREQTVELRLKTKDQVTFGLNIRVIYNISKDPDEAYKASYELEKYKNQIRSFSIDSAIPVANNLLLEEIYNSKDKITSAAKMSLVKYFSAYGINIRDVLSDEPSLPAGVEESANAVIEAKRKEEAAKFNAKAIKIEKVGGAEADGESIRIRMEKIGKARESYAQTAGSAVASLVEHGVTPSEALDFLNTVGEHDMFVTAARSANTVLLSPSKGNDTDSVTKLAALMSQLTADKVVKPETANDD